MSVIIHFRGPIARQLDSPNYTIDIGEKSKIGDLLQILLESEIEIKQIWKDPESIDAEAMILVNEVDIGLTGGLNTQIKEGDELIILPLVHGGRLRLFLQVRRIINFTKIKISG